MGDHNWNKGFYYDDNSIYPFYGMRNARIIGYTTYRSGPGKF